MHIFNYVILTLFFCVIPAGVLWLCRKVSFLDKIGPVLILYVVGVIVGNMPFMPSELPSLQEALSSVMVPLAIPMMLFCCTFRRSETRTQLLALVTGLIAVVAAVVGGYFIFGDHIQDANKIGGMLSGVYTGGTLNLAALKTMLGVSDETYILLNSYDMLVSFLYLTFLLSIGIKLLRKFLPVKKSEYSDDDARDIEGEITRGKSNPYSGIFSKSGLRQIGLLFGITLMIVAVSGGIALLLPKSWFMVAFILLLTTFGIAGSFVKPIRKLDRSYDVGMYLIYIFCVVVASMADLSKLDFANGMYLLGYLGFVVFVSLALNAILAKICRVDADTMIICSVAFINSPPFVPMMAAAMRNRNVMVIGLSTGLIGYAIGNYLGFFISEILAKF